MKNKITRHNDYQIRTRNTNKPMVYIPYMDARRYCGTMLTEYLQIIQDFVPVRVQMAETVMPSKKISTTNKIK